MAPRDLVVLALMVVVTAVVLVVTSGSLVAILALAAGWVVYLSALRKERAAR